MVYTRKAHLTKEYNTRDLILYIINNYEIKNHEKIFGLIKLTWFGNTAKIDGYNLIFNKKFNSLNKIISSIEDNKLKQLFSKNTGFTNFYRAYRNSAFKWAAKNHNQIQKIFKHGQNIKNDYDIIKISKLIEEFPYILRANSQKIKMKSESLITPLLACLDPTNRFPIINRNENVIELHRMMGISNSSLSEKVYELLEIMKENKIINSLFLDVYSKNAIKKKVKRIQKENRKISKELLPKDDADVKYLLTENRRVVVRKHRKIEKKLLSFCKQKGIEVEEGIYSKLKFDAILRKYKNGTDLLVEIKGSNKVSEIRLAIGQVLDYGFDFKNTETDLAILLPKKPENKYIQIAKRLNIKVLWLSERKIVGTIRI